MQGEPAKDLAEQIIFGLVNASFFPEEFDVSLDIAIQKR